MPLPISCLVEVPEAYERKAWYAIRMLFFPFRVTVGQFLEGQSSECTLYYGTHPDRAPRGALRIGVTDETLGWIERCTPDLPSDAQIRIEGQDLPRIAGSRGDISFDPVAATFYFLSGWQEWVSKSRDVHGRFPYAGSIQHRLGTASIPCVEYYRHYLADVLRQRGIPLEQKSWGGREWTFCPTHDVDYLRKWRPGILYREIVERAAGNRLNESSRKRLRRAAGAVSGLVGTGDPYRKALERLRTEVQERGGTATFFFKVAARGPHDVHYSPKGRYVTAQYRALREAGFEIGLHPGYHAFDHAGYMVSERRLLQEASLSDVKSVRTHYLRFQQRATPQAMLGAGFEIDSSLGFSDHTGFRNGTCLPFVHFDLIRDEETTLLELPLAVMESALFNREQLTAAEAGRKTEMLMESCRRFGGVFVGLWHNVLWDEVDFPGWGRHFTESLDAAEGQGAHISSLQDAVESWS